MTSASDAASEAQWRPPLCDRRADDERGKYPERVWMCGHAEAAEREGGGEPRVGCRRASSAQTHRLRARSMQRRDPAPPRESHATQTFWVKANQKRREQRDRHARAELERDGICGGGGDRHRNGAHRVHSPRHRSNRDDVRPHVPQQHVERKAGRM